VAHQVWEHRVGDRRIIRLRQKWIKAGVLERIVTGSEQGDRAGIAVLAPLMANSTYTTFSTLLSDGDA